MSNFLIFLLCDVQKPIGFLNVLARRFPKVAKTHGRLIIVVLEKLVPKTVPKEAQEGQDII